MLFRICAVLCNFYPRPPRGGRRLVFYRGQRNRIISIHALREEGDRYGRPESGIRRISIHALREEGDTIPQIEINGESDFYPRPPRGGRHRRRRKKTKQKYFYPRPPRGGRPTRSVANVLTLVFLSTPSARRATKSPTACRAFWEFLSTPSARRATLHGPRDGLQHSISIHALREEGDGAGGENNACRSRFLSTPSARRATRPL